MSGWLPITSHDAIPKMAQKWLPTAKKFRKGTRESERQSKRKHKAMCFTAYLWLGHYEYRTDIKQIRPGMTLSMERERDRERDRERMREREGNKQLYKAKRCGGGGETERKKESETEANREKIRKE